MRIDGKQLAHTILEDLQERVVLLQSERNIIPHVAIIRVGDDPATTSYVKQKERMGKKIGAVVSVYNCPQNISEKELLNTIHFLQAKGDIHGLIVQLPLPQHISEETIIMAIDDDKDVDGFKPNSPFVEPIAAAVLRILEEIHVLDQKNPPSGGFTQWMHAQTIVVMGKGKTGGMPIIHLLKKMRIGPIIIDSKTHNREEVIRSADILICAVGNKGTLVHEDMLKKDAILIGIGMHKAADGTLHGDYEADDIRDKAAYYTPIPGGVGPVNAAMLLVNVIQAAENKL